MGVTLYLAGPWGDDWASGIARWTPVSEPSGFLDSGHQFTSRRHGFLTGSQRVEKTANKISQVLSGGSNPVVLLLPQVLDVDGLGVQMLVEKSSMAGGRLLLVGIEDRLQFKELASPPTLRAYKGVDEALEALGFDLDHYYPWRNQERFSKIRAKDV